MNNMLTLTPMMATPKTMRKNKAKSWINTTINLNMSLTRQVSPNEPANDRKNPVDQLDHLRRRLRLAEKQTA
jgi:hypothetical protein